MKYKTQSNIDKAIGEVRKIKYEMEKAKENAQNILNKDNRNLQDDINISNSLNSYKSTMESDYSNLFESVISINPNDPVNQQFNQKQEQKTSSVYNTKYQYRKELMGEYFNEYSQYQQWGLSSHNSRPETNSQTQQTSQNMYLARPQQPQQYNNQQIRFTLQPAQQNNITYQQQSYNFQQPQQRSFYQQQINTQQIYNIPSYPQPQQPQYYYTNLQPVQVLYPKQQVYNIITQQQPQQPVNYKPNTTIRPLQAQPFIPSVKTKF